MQLINVLHPAHITAVGYFINYYTTSGLLVFFLL